MSIALKSTLMFAFTLLALVMISSSVLAIMPIDVTESSLTLEEERDESAEGTFTLVITGTFDVIAKYTQSDFSDGSKDIILSFDPDIISSSYSTTTGSYPIDITATIDEDIELDTYSGTITIEEDGNPSNNDTFTLEVRVRPQDLCSDGTTDDPDGNLKIDDIDDPNNGDEFDPGDRIDIDVKIENDYDEDLDVKLTAFLIDKEEDDVLPNAEDSDVQEIDEGETEEFEFDIKVPADIEEKSTSRYAVYIQATEEGNEDDHCVWKQVDIDIDKEKDSVLVEDINVQDTLICGILNDIEVDIVNAGTKDQDNVKVILSISGVTLNAVEKTWEIPEIKDGKDMTLTFSINLPAGIAEGDHTINAKIYDGDGRDYKNGYSGEKVTIICAPAEPEASLTLSPPSISVRKDSSFTVTATVTNTGDTEETFTLKVTPIGAWIDPFETSFTLDIGESQAEVLTFIAKQEGSQSATVEVLDVDGEELPTRTTKILTASITSTFPSGITGAVTATPLSKQWPLFTAIGILALAVIVLLIWLIALYARGNPGKKSSKGLREVKEAVKGRRR